ncbi:MAG: 2'-5' RNA ligase family protein [Lapillicoccus sp.]
MPFASAMPSPLGPPTHSAVIVAVPPAEPVVGHHRREHDASTAWGVPAHVTVLFPFMEPRALDDHVHAKLTRAVATVPEFTTTFGSTSWFEDKVLWLAPDPAEPFRVLTTSVAAAFPEHPPYAGAYEDVVPHLTVGVDAPAEKLRAVERQVQPELPVEMRVTEVQVIVGRPEVGGSWDVIGRFPLA